MTIDEFMNRVSDVMILKMKELNLSNADIARALNVNKSTVGDWVNKTTLIKSNMIKPLCDILQITPNFLYNVSSDEDITEALKEGDKVVISGFGQFEVKERAAREGVNPATGEKITIPATRVPGFKAGKGLKDSVK